MMCQEVLPCGHCTDNLQAACPFCRERFAKLEQECGYAACAAGPCAAMTVEVRTVGGAVFASVRASPDETIGDLKQRLFICAAERRVGRLISGCMPLSDDRRLEDCLVVDG